MPKAAGGLLSVPTTMGRRLGEDGRGQKNEVESRRSIEMN